MLNHYREAVLIDSEVSAIIENKDILQTKHVHFFAPEMFSREQFQAHGERIEILAVDFTFFYLLSR